MVPNILVDLLPESVLVGGRECPIRTDFRVFILFELLWQEEDLSGEEKLRMSLRLCYPDPPGDTAGAANAMLWFYRCGRDGGRRGRAQAGGGHGRAYSFGHDAGLIYAAFLSQYGIDLQDIGHLHWWKFRAMFQALSDQTEFVKVMGYRGIEVTEGMTASQKEFYRRMKRVHALPLQKGEEELQEAVEAALLGGGDLAGLL